MGKKLSLNEEKFKVAFIFLNEGCNPKKTVLLLNLKKSFCTLQVVQIIVRQKPQHRRCQKKVALLLIYAVLSEMKVLPASAKPLIEKYQQVLSISIFILFSEIRAVMICSKKTSGALDFNHLFVETKEIKGTVVKTAPDSMADVPVCYTESLPYFYEIILLAKSKFVNFYEMLTVSVLHIF